MTARTHGRAGRRRTAVALGLASLLAAATGAVAPVAPALARMPQPPAEVADGPAVRIVGPTRPAGRASVGTEPSERVNATRRVALTLRPGVRPEDVAATLAAAGLRTETRIDQIGTIVVDAASSAARDAAIATLARDTRFSSVEAPHLLHAAGMPAGDGTAAAGLVDTADPMLATEWWLDSIDVRPAWDWPMPAAPVTIAIVDSGVDLSHPDLAPILLPGRNFVTPGRDPQDDNVIGHGTHVAGIAAAAASGGTGMVGVDPNARILPVKILDASGFADDTTAAAGITWAADNGARVINLSLEGAPTDPCSTALVDAVDYALSKNVVVVAASGNSAGEVGCPARIPGVLAVGAVAQDGSVWGRSNQGAQLSLVAPGVGITSTIPVSMGSYGKLTGTSMASPMVAGAAALIASAAPGIAGAEIASALTSTAKDLGPTGKDPTYGAGILDVGAALAATAAPVAAAKVTPPVITGQAGDTTATARLEFSVTAGFTGTVAVERADGTIVRTLSSDPLKKGEASFTWDATDDAGQRVPDGDYVFAIRGAGPGGVPVAVTAPVAVSAALAGATVTPGTIAPTGSAKVAKALVRYTLLRPATVTVGVLDASGRLVRTLATGARPVGASTVTWDGRRSAAPGAPVVADGQYSIAVRATTPTGSWTTSASVRVSTKGVAVAGLAATTVFPFVDGYRDTSTISFTVARRASVTVFVYPAASAVPTRTIRAGTLAGGAASVRWDGRAGSGKVVPAGTYRVKVRTTDDAGVVRWSGEAKVVVSAKRLVPAVFTMTLRGDQRDPRSFATSAGAAIEEVAGQPGTIRLRSADDSARAVALWVFEHPAWQSITSARVTLRTVRDGEGASSAGTWRGGDVASLLTIGSGGGLVSFDIPPELVDPAGSSVAVAAAQTGPGSLDVASVKIEIRYSTLR